MEQEEQGDESGDDSEQEANDELDGGEQGRSNKRQKIYESQMPLWWNRAIRFRLDKHMIR